MGKTTVMVYSKHDFDDRVNVVDGKHAKLLRRGYTVRVDRNGLLVAQPKPRKFRFPIRGLALLVGGFFCFKALALGMNGPATYGDRLASLESGTVVEVLGARVLAIDPVTQFLADKIGPLLR